MRLFLIPILYVTTVFAIIDISSVDFGDKENGFSGSAYGSFQKKRGNTEKDEAEYGGRIEYDTNKTITWLQASVEKDKAGSNTTDDNSFVHLRHIHQIYNPSWAMEFYTQVKQDKFQSLQNRSVYGIGPRYKVVDSKNYGKLFICLSVMDERIKYTDTTLNPDEENCRMSSYLSYKMSIDKNLELSYLGYYQPKIDNGSDYLTASSAEMTIHLTRVFDLSYLIEFDYDSKPPLEVLKTDTRQKLSFIYRFGKDDPFSTYADSLLHSSNGSSEVNASSVIAVKAETGIQDTKDLTDTLFGKWVFGKETLTLLSDGKGKYFDEDGVYKEKLTWNLASIDTKEGTGATRNQATKLVVIRFRDEEGRLERVENYLWSENTLVSLRGNSVRLFKR